jgi:ubiquinone/menaquinone biosynthesis C-methylase UbiE
MTDTDLQFPDVSRFSAVDDVEDPHQLIDVLDVAKRLPGFAVAKTQLLDRLDADGASSALDVGCGYGRDVIALAERLKPDGRAIGIDLSEAMIVEAQRRAGDRGLNVEFIVADALALPFEDSTFDVCRIETVLQHVADSESAVAEMIRVTRPGGRVGALELDPGTMYIDHPDVELFDQLRSSFIRSVVGSMARGVPRLFAEAGLIDVRVAAHVITGDPYAYRLMLAHHVEQLCARGALTPERSRRFWDTIDAAAASGHFTGGITSLVVVGTVNSEV